jgi:hypothetical protein
MNLHTLLSKSRSSKCSLPSRFPTKNSAGTDYQCINVRIKYEVTIQEVNDKGLMIEEVMIYDVNDTGH